MSQIAKIWCDVASLLLGTGQHQLASQKKSKVLLDVISRDLKRICVCWRRNREVDVIYWKRICVSLTSPEMLRVLALWIGRRWRNSTRCWLLTATWHSKQKSLSSLLMYMDALSLFSNLALDFTRLWLSEASMKDQRWSPNSKIGQTEAVFPILYGTVCSITLIFGIICFDYLFIGHMNLFLWKIAWSPRN